MAKRGKKEKIVLEDVELKPQVIGYTYKKKSNIGRVILIFIIFALAVYYINDISVFINNLLGKETNKNIQNLTQNKDNNTNKNDKEDNDIIYNVYENNMVITEKEFVLNNFILDNTVLTFDINNNSDKIEDLSSRKFFIETYSEDKILLERFKIDINFLEASSKINYKLDINKKYYYIVLVEKNLDDYPNINLNDSTITCIKDSEKIIYNFSNNELNEIEHTIIDNNIDDNYFKRYSECQKKADSYKNIEGITSTFNGSVNGYTAVFKIDLSKVSLEKLEKYYFKYKELPKVVKFEMETYGFKCN